MFGWTGVHVPLLVSLPVLLILSGFFSGSETALFGLSESQRAELRRTDSFAARAVTTLANEPRMLLITILLGNMTINVLYFVISSVLMMEAETGWAGQLILGLVSLLALILLGEVIPKMTANSHRTRFALVISTPILALHRGIGPLRIVLDRGVVEPLSRLTAPGAVPPQVSADELAALLELSGREGIIDTTEQRMLNGVLGLGRYRVRDVMTPRVEVRALPERASRSAALALAKEYRIARAPVYRGDLDTIVGVVDLRTFLRSEDRTIARLTRPAEFIPELATLDQLLERFRASHTLLAVAVDEYGGTAGIITIEDVVEEIVSELGGETVETDGQFAEIGHRTWRVSGDLDVHDWVEMFGPQIISPRISTLGGLITQNLGRLPRPGDIVLLGNVRITVEDVVRHRVMSAIVSLGNGAEGSAAPEASNAD